MLVEYVNLTVAEIGVLEAAATEAEDLDYIDSLIRLPAEGGRPYVISLDRLAEVIDCLKNKGVYVSNYFTSSTGEAVKTATFPSEELALIPTGRQLVARLGAAAPWRKPHV